MSAATTNINLVGVGGQGILLTADVLARTAAEAGLDVKKTEIHGMSQRGGSVSSQVRFGASVLSPIVPAGEADILVAFDEVEAIRAFPSLRPSGKALVDRCYLVPVTVSSGRAKYPADVPARLAKVFPRLVACDCEAEAVRMGNPKLAHTILAGMLSERFGMEVGIDAGRIWPAPDDGENYREIFEALENARYDGRVSIEAGCEDMKVDGPKAFAVLDAARRG